MPATDSIYETVFENLAYATTSPADSLELEAAQTINQMFINGFDLKPMHVDDDLPKR